MSDPRLHNRIRRRRKAEGLSQRALAERLGVSRQTVHAIETGVHVPSTSLGLRMARHFGCRVEDLFVLPPDPGLRARVAPVASKREVGSRVALGRVEGQWVAHRLPDHGMSAADGILTGEGGEVGATEGDVLPLADVDHLLRNVLVAGCAPLLGAVAHRMGRRFSDARVTWLRAGNGRAVELLTKGLVHVAGLHMSVDEADDDTVAAARRALPGRRLLVVNLTRWRQGLVVPAGNPRGLTGGGDLLDPDLRVVRREEGSGANALAARIVEAEGACGLPGDGPLADGHAEVARLVRWGAADVGIAIEGAALAEGLDFVPLAEERFDLIVPEAVAATTPVSRLVDALGARGFRTEVSHLPGYDGTLSGQVTTVEAA